MGLDQYAYAAMRAGQRDEFWETAELDKDTREFTNPNITKPRELMCWRKHPNLQGWMERLWESRGRPGVPAEGAPYKVDRTFNGVELELEWRDIEQLESAIQRRRLPATEGFFFGGNSDDYYIEKDLEFCREARAALFLGERVFYNSSW
jgi:hypothetical protein